MPLKRNTGRPRIYRGGNVVQQPPQEAQMVAQAPAQQVPAMVQAPAQVPAQQLVTFPAKIRLNVSEGFKSVIEAKEDAEIVLEERINAGAKYGNPNVYFATFGNDEETGSPIDVYTKYVYDRLRDMNKKTCKLLQYRGDAPVESSGVLGVGATATTRRQECAKDVKAVIADDNRILKAWVAQIEENGIKFLEKVNDAVAQLQDAIKDMGANRADLASQLKDVKNELNDNIESIRRETEDKLNEIERIAREKEDRMGEKMDAEVASLQQYIREEIAITAEIAKLEKQIDELDAGIEAKGKELAKLEKGLNNVMLNLQQKGLNFEQMIQMIEQSIQQNMIGGGSIKQLVRKLTNKKTLAAATGAAVGSALVAGRRKKRKSKRKRKSRKSRRKSRKSRKGGKRKSKKSRKVKRKSRKSRRKSRKSRRRTRGGGIIKSAKKILKKVTSKRAIAAATGAAVGAAIVGGKRKRRSRRKSKKSRRRRSKKKN